MGETQQAPREAYLRRLQDRKLAAQVHRRSSMLFSYARLVIFIAGAVMLWPVLFDSTLGLVWLLLPFAAFIAVARAHEREIRKQLRMERAASYYERALDRLDDRWAGQGNPGAGFIDPCHPYAADLDLFGEGSLYELLCTARTASGERTLAGWLAAPADPATLRHRQQAVEELRDKLDLREDLAVLGTEGSAVDPDGLIAWGAAPAVLDSRWPTWVAAALAVFNLAALYGFVAWALGAPGNPGTNLINGPTPLVVAVLASAGFAALFSRRVGQVLGHADRPERDLLLLSQVLSRLERERFESPRLAELRSALDAAGKPPSSRIARLVWLVELNEARRNMVFAPFATLILLATQLGFAMERWRRTSGRAVGCWVDAVGQLEALSALAGFAYENPDHPFPEFADGGPCFEGRALGHPLLPKDRSVTNDVSLGNGLQLMLISGSNMSGKSTLMRTVGVNAVLALAGAPVDAVRLRLSPLNIGACMRVTDSLQEGMSHFYAEIKRLSQLVDLGRGAPPLLFLLDEVLHGTNSHDRRIGAEALIRGLVRQGSIGMVTTHDLALTKIADDLDPRAVNVHFEDRLEDGKIVFDYRLREGVVRKSNALALMRAVGLEV